MARLSEGKTLVNDFSQTIDAICVFPIIFFIKLYCCVCVWYVHVKSSVIAHKRRRDDSFVVCHNYLYLLNQLLYSSNLTIFQIQKLHNMLLECGIIELGLYLCWGNRNNQFRILKLNQLVRVQ